MTKLIFDLSFNILKLVWSFFKLMMAISLMLLMLYILWYGFKFETGDIVIEAYGIGRFFK